MSRRSVVSSTLTQRQSWTRRTRGASVPSMRRARRQNELKSCSPMNTSAPRRITDRSRGGGTNHAVAARNGSGISDTTIV